VISAEDDLFGTFKGGSYSAEHIPDAHFVGYPTGGHLLVGHGGDEARATQGLVASQRVGDRYYLPRNLSILADLKARRGRVAEAKALYEQAEDVIEGMLISVDEPYWNSSVVAAMSQTYGYIVKRVKELGASSSAHLRSPASASASTRSDAKRQSTRVEGHRRKPLKGTEEAR
jgi:hypothetical protein